ncbi:hypothetical protein [Legionella drancourtii]|uniref:Phosphatase n=1 Tax=Legionella drancourtii LLAP12 TaxID=658187 RepID=G9EUI4_9GAMM|nr:hypothetical protein [Legionella drancourtii]EHL28984.1 hypothetical protein LDG_8978 [Legionella drancourtii LLAP12]
MGKLNPEGMMEIANAKNERVSTLKNLIAQPFDVNNLEQLAKIKKYLNDFEFSANQMYLFQGMSTGIKAWGGSWLMGRILPIPDFASYFLTAFLYFGAAGYILQKFNTNDFHDQLEEMKTIYNWCLKGNKEVYDEANNNEKLNHPEIQRMIELLAPLCSTNFMCVWPKVTDESGPTSGLGIVVNASQKLYSRFFSATPQPSDKLKALQIKVENGELALNAFSGAEKAIHYFATDPNFRATLMAKVQIPIDYAKGMLPEMLTAGFSHSKAA